MTTINERTGIKTYESMDEKEIRSQMYKVFKESPIPEQQVLSNLGLFLNSKSLARILFMAHIYQKIVSTQGVVVEFGTRWGQNLALFAALRGIFEPFNRHRKIIGFDTFEGFPSVSVQDGKSDMINKGNLAVTKNYDQFLDKLLSLNERDNPLGHIKKYELRKGDACLELEKYLKDNPQTIVSLAYFDFDLYEPTKKCLNLIKGRLTKGSVVGFDELNDPDSPGETLAVIEELGLQNIRLKRLPYVSRTSYFEIE